MAEIVTIERCIGHAATELAAVFSQQYTRDKLLGLENAVRYTIIAMEMIAEEAHKKGESLPPRWKDIRNLLKETL